MARLFPKDEFTGNDKQCVNGLPDLLWCFRREKTAAVGKEGIGNGNKLRAVVHAALAGTVVGLLFAENGGIRVGMVQVCHGLGQVQVDIGGLGTRPIGLFFK